MLQLALDRISSWAKENKLKINPAKTIFIHFKKNNKDTCNYGFDVDGINITKSKTVKDLGVIFDEDYSFKQQYIAINIRCRSLLFAAKRFCKEIKERRIMMFIYNTYIRPIMEYCSIIWHKDIAYLNNNIEWIQREASRTALGSAFRPNQDNYLNYEDRCKRLNIISTENRFKINQVITIKKLMEGDITSKFGEILKSNKSPQLVIRNRRMFNVDVNVIALDSPLYNAIVNYHKLEKQFKFKDSVQLIKNSLQKYLKGG